MTGDTVKDFRDRARNGELSSNRAGLSLDLLQANVAIVPEACADPFHVYCLNGAMPRPRVDVGETGARSRKDSDLISTSATTSRETMNIEMVG